MIFYFTKYSDLLYDCFNTVKSFLTWVERGESVGDYTLKARGPKVMASSKGQKIGRDSKTGQFIPVKEAQKRPSTTQVETIKKPPNKGK